MKDLLTKKILLVKTEPCNSQLRISEHLQDVILKEMKLGMTMYKAREKYKINTKMATKLRNKLNVGYK